MKYKGEREMYKVQRGKGEGKPKANGLVAFSVGQRPMNRGSLPKPLQRKGGDVIIRVNWAGKKKKICAYLRYLREII